MYTGFTYSFSMVFLVNGFLYVLYALKHPLIERYKCIDGPWPWDEDQAEWAKLLRKSLLIYCFNACIISPLTFTLNYVANEPIFYDTTMDGIPNSL